jgi:hypothetical protein
MTPTEPFRLEDVLTDEELHDIEDKGGRHIHWMRAAIRAAAEKVGIGGLIRPFSLPFTTQNVVAFLRCEPKPLPADERIEQALKEHEGRPHIIGLPCCRMAKILREK